jgi:hypothetical protein
VHTLDLYSEQIRFATCPCQVTPLSATFNPVAWLSRGAPDFLFLRRQAIPLWTLLSILGTSPSGLPLSSLTMRPCRSSACGDELFAIAPFPLCCELQRHRLVDLPAIGGYTLWRIKVFVNVLYPLCPPITASARSLAACPCTGEQMVMPNSSRYVAAPDGECGKSVIGLLCIPLRDIK